MGSRPNKATKTMNEMVRMTRAMVRTIPMAEERVGGYQDGDIVGDAGIMAQGRECQRLTRLSR